MQRWISWQEVNDAIDEISNMLEISSAHIDCIVALARGGFIPAYLLSRSLDIGYLSSIGVCYGDGTRDEPKMYSAPAFHTPPTTILLVEDQVETGCSMWFARDTLARMTSRVVTCSLFAWELADFKPDVVAFTTQLKGEIIFPWEY